MSGPAKKALPLAGIIFLVVAVVEFLQGDNWVVWAILGFLFGGFGIFGGRGQKEGET